MLGGYKKITGGGRCRTGSMRSPRKKSMSIKCVTGHDPRSWRDDPPSYRIQLEGCRTLREIDAKVRSLIFVGCLPTRRMFDRPGAPQLEDRGHVYPELRTWSVGFPSAPKLMAEDDKFEGATVMTHSQAKYVIVLDLIHVPRS